MGGLIEYFRGLREVITRNRPQYVCNLIRAKLYSALHPGALTIAVLNGKDTIRLLKESRKSLIRWGDADTRAFLGGNLYYQPWSKQLVQKLRLISSKYSNTTPYVLAIPRPSVKALAELEKTGKRKHWETTRYLLATQFNQDARYGDSTLFYTEEVTRATMKSLWKDAAHIIVVQNGTEGYDFIRKDRRPKNTIHIEAPDHDAFSHYSSLKEQCLTIITDRKWQKRDVLVILSCGPAARVIAYELAHEGYRTYDLGTLLGRTALDADTTLQSTRRQRSRP